MRVSPPPAAYTAYSVVRAVAAPDAPFDGVLARTDEGRTVLLVDRDHLAPWTGWDAAAGEHVLAPLDIARRADGHDVVLPALAERIDRFLARRSAPVDLSRGEIVTLAVSVLRGHAQLCVAGCGDEPAEWWLTVDGRPLAVPGIGGDSVARSSAALFAVLAQDAPPDLRDAIEAAAARFADPRTFTRWADAAEDALFACADPEPLARDVLGTRRARPVTPRGEHPEESAVADVARPWWAAIARHFDAGLSDSASDALDRARRFIRRPGRRRLRPVLWASVVAVVVLTAGLAWPDDADPPAEARVGESPRASTAPASTAPSAGASSPPVAPSGSAADDPVSALDDLLAARRSCLDDACRAAVLEDPAREVADGAVSAEQVVISLIDDFGGLAVLRAEDGSGAATPQLVTVVATPEGWRIRDVFDAADPS